MFRFLTSKDVLLGLVYISVGVVYGVYTTRDLAIGRALNMGPGYFPAVLSGMMVVIGLIVLLQGLPNWRERPFGFVNWRSVICILASVVVFSLLARPAGMIIASFATALVASAASRFASVVGALVTAAFLSIFCSLVFIYGMGLPMGLFGTWFR